MTEATNSCESNAEIPITSGDQQQSSHSGSAKSVDLTNVKTIQGSCKTLLCCKIFRSQEMKVLTEILKKVEILFFSTLEELRNRNSVSASDITKVISCINNLVTANECLNPLLQHLKSLEDLPVEVIGSVPKIVFNILFKAIDHCIHSEGIYGNLFHSIHVSLNSLFHTSRQLLAETVGFLDEADNYEVTSESQVDSFVSICERLCDLSRVFQNVDLKIMAQTWRIYTKLVARHQVALQQKLDVAPTIQYLCREIRELAVTFLVLPVSPESSEEQLESKKILKLCGFKIKLVVTLCNKFAKNLGSCIPDVTSLVLFLFELGSPVKGHSSVELHQCLTVAIEPLTVSLLEERAFAESLSGGKEDAYALVLLSLLVMDRIPVLDREMFDLWLCPEYCILSRVFECVAHCQVECMLPAHLQSVMCNGKAQRLVTLYEYACTHVCAFVASLPAKHFPRLERVLLRSLLSSDWLKGSLACDVWCFVARFATSDICFSHCCTLMEIQTSWNSWQCPTLLTIHLLCLLRRLVGFLSPTHKSALQKKFSWNLHFLGFSLHSALSKTAAKFTRDAFCKLSHQVCHCYSQLRNGDTSAATEENIAILTSLSVRLPRVCKLDHDIGNRMMVLVFKSLGLAVASFTNVDALARILNLFSDAVMERCELCHLSFLVFSEPLAGVSVPLSSAQSKIVLLLAQNFSRSLRVTSGLLHQYTLQVFAEFARRTPHANLLPLVFRSCPPAQQEITSY